MNWEAFGAIGEAVGAVAVVLSLIYLGVQIKNQNAERRAATVQAFSDQQISLMSNLIDNADIWDKILSGTPLSEGEETRKGILVFNMVLIEIENTFFQHKSGYLSESYWKGRIENLKSFVNLPFYSVWVQSFGPRARDVEFLQIIERLVERSDS